jgi:ribosomal protein S25
MISNKSNSFIKSFKKGLQGKNTTIQTIKQSVYDYLEQDTATTKMLSLALDIKVSSLCAAIRTLEKNGKLQKVVKTLCDATDNKAFYITTNKALFRNNYLK